MLNGKNKKIMIAMAMVVGAGMAFPPNESSAMTRQQSINAINYQNAQQEQERQIVALYNNGLNSYTAGNYENCIRYLSINSVAAKYQRLKDYNIAIGDSYYKLQRYPQAVPYLKRAYNTGASEIAIVNTDLGLSLYAMGYPEQGAPFLKKVAYTTATNGDILWALATASDKMGNKQEMLKALNVLIQRYPSYNKDAYIILGAAQIDSNKLNSALNIYLQGLKYFPNDGDLLYWAGHVCFIDGNYEGAIPYLLKSNEILPDNIDTLYDLGASYLNLDRLDEAAQVADVMLKINKDHEKTQDLYQAVQQKIMQKQMEQQMQQEMIDQSIRSAQEAADLGMAQASMEMPAGMM